MQATRTDLAVESFIAMRDMFFNEDGEPREISLRKKRSNQDDPLSEYICEKLKSVPGIECLKSSPNVSPDLVVLRPELCSAATREELRSDITRILAIEVKKLQRNPRGGIRRPTGLDYNTSPPCYIVRVYDRRGNPFEIRAFYLFLCEELVEPGREKDKYKVTALVLCDGRALNEDFELYLSAVEPRRKEIDLGTYGDGINRHRPMYVFANPLGVPEFDGHATLIHSSPALERRHPQLKLAYILRRRTRDGQIREFYCYRLGKDVPPIHRVGIIDDFPRPQRRSEETQRRGLFKIRHIDLEAATSHNQGRLKRLDSFM